MPIKSSLEMSRIVSRSTARFSVLLNFPEITAPAISQHLKALRAAKLVRARAQGQRRIYSLNPEGIEELGGWIDQLRQFWAGKFDALDTALRSAPEQDVKQLDTGDGNERKG